MEEISLARRFRKFRGLGSTLIAFVAWIVVLFAFAAIDPVILEPQNIMNLLRSISFYLLIGIGQSYVMITGNIDLSIGSVVGMSAMISSTLMTWSLTSVPLAILVAFVSCASVGLINGILVGKFNLPSYIATLGTMYIARGVAYMVTRNRSTDSISYGIGKEAAALFQNFFYNGKTFGIYNTFLIALAIFAIFFFILSKTRTGRQIYAIGSNINAAKLSGVNAQATIIKVYVVSSINACIVGYFLVAQASMGNMEAGLSYEMYGVAAGVIGGISPLGGTGSLLGVFAGAGVWQTLQNGLSMIGTQVGFQRVVIGAIVIIVVLLNMRLRAGKGLKRIKVKTRANVNASIDTATVTDNKDTYN
ncbi:MAG: ABC transporter permease [Oscillospiraceae bacterium]|nr:ABC transporter permease [Oscillospiraceae bacterium]